MFLGSFLCLQHEGSFVLGLIIGIANSTPFTEDMDNVTRCLLDRHPSYSPIVVKNYNCNQRLPAHIHLFTQQTSAECLLQAEGCPFI